MSDLTPKGFSNGQYVDRFLLRDKLYAEDAITMKGVAILNEFPAADVVERKRGKWERDKNNGLQYCPFCDSVAPAEDQYGEMIIRPPFCHQCGSDLREGKDG